MLARELPPGGTVSHQESVAYLGLNYVDLIARVGVAEARETYRREGRQAFLPTRLMRDVFEAWKPSLVVATNSPRSERAAIAAAGELAIPAVCQVDLFALQEVKWIGAAGFADRVCVLNDQVREMFLARGRRPEEVVVTGNPAFDRLLAPEAVAAGTRLRKTRGWDDGRVTILWASQVEPERHPFAPERVGDPSLPRRVEARLREFVSHNQGFRLVVRYHPSEHEEFLPQPRVEFSPPAESLSALLHAVDIVVVTASTVGLEASLAGRPVLSVDCSIFTADAPYSEMGISLGVAGVDLVPAALLQLARRLPREPAADVADGASATARVLQVIDSLCH